MPLTSEEIAFLSRDPNNSLFDPDAPTRNVIMESLCSAMEASTGKAFTFPHDTRSGIRDSAPLDPKGEAGSKKCPLALIPPTASRLTAFAHKYGADRYGAFNWRTSRVNTTTYISALMRHVDAYRDGEDFDPDSGLPHLAHIAANANILMDAGHCGVLEDDRYKKPL